MTYNRQLLNNEMVRQGLSRKRIADLTGLSPVTVNQCLTTETGRPDSLYEIAKALGFPVKRRKKVAVSGKTVFVYDLTAIINAEDLVEIIEK